MHLATSPTLPSSIPLTPLYQQHSASHQYRRASRDLRPRSASPAADADRGCVRVVHIFDHDLSSPSAPVDAQPYVAQDKIYLPHPHHRQHPSRSLAPSRPITPTLQPPPETSATSLELSSGSLAPPNQSPNNTSSNSLVRSSSQLSHTTSGHSHSRPPSRSETSHQSHHHPPLSPSSASALHVNVLHSGHNHLSQSFLASSSSFLSSSSALSPSHSTATVTRHPSLAVRVREPSGPFSALRRKRTVSGTSGGSGGGSSGSRTPVSALRGATSSLLSLTRAGNKRITVRSMSTSALATASTPGPTSAVAGAGGRGVSYAHSGGTGGGRTARRRNGAATTSHLRVDGAGDVVRVPSGRRPYVGAGAGAGAGAGVGKSATTLNRGSSLRIAGGPAASGVLAGLEKSYRNVVVVGVSVAGLSAARALVKKLPPTHRLVLIDAADAAFFPTAVPRSLHDSSRIGSYLTHSLSHSHTDTLSKLFPPQSRHFVLAHTRVESLSPRSLVVDVSNARTTEVMAERGLGRSRIDFDYAILAVGSAQLFPFSPRGMTRGDEQKREMTAAEREPDRSSLVGAPPATVSRPSAVAELRSGLPVGNGGGGGGGGDGPADASSSHAHDFARPLSALSIRNGLRQANTAVLSATCVLVVGGGCTGCETVAEIKSAFPNRRVVLVEQGKMLAQGLYSWPGWGRTEEERTRMRMRRDRSASTAALEMREAAPPPHQQQEPFAAAPTTADGKSQEERLKARPSLLALGRGKSKEGKLHGTTDVERRREVLDGGARKMHDALFKRLTEMGVELCLGDQVDLEASGVDWEDSGKLRRDEESGVRELKTRNGKTFKPDLVILALPPRPRSSLVSDADPFAVDPYTEQILVKPTFEIDSDVLGGRWFAVGDCCDRPEPKMAQTAAAHGPVVAANILTLLAKGDDESTRRALKKHKPMTRPWRVVVLGRDHGVVQTPLPLVSPIFGDWLAGFWTGNRRARRWQQGYA